MSRTARLSKIIAAAAGARLRSQTELSERLAAEGVPCHPGHAVP